MIHLLDTGPLVSALAREEPRFGSWAKDLLRHLPRPLYTCEAVLTEVTHFLGNADPILAAVADGLLVCLRISVVFDGQNAPDIHGQRWTASSLPHIA